LGGGIYPENARSLKETSCESNFFFGRALGKKTS
jgi:hypothetical protein